ncbi:MAG: hypothetical protein COA42_14730 [Alteromonadaceae bacterium]|nr:MAG: hypothetical protein COA42_14730 [Alteromonadaceae bacterium]
MDSDTTPNKVHILDATHKKPGSTGSLSDNPTIMIIAIGSRGDVQPAIILGKHLQKLGYQVKIFSSKDFGSLIVSQGLESISSGENIRALFSTEDGVTLMNLGHKQSEFFEQQQKMYDKSEFKGTTYDVVLACEGADAVISFNNMHLGITIAEYYDIKHIELNFFPLSEVLSPGETRFIDQPASEAIDHLREQHFGLSRLSDVEYSDACARALRIQAYSRHVIPKYLDVPENVQYTGFLYKDLDGSWTPPASLEAFIEGSAGLTPTIPGKKIPIVSIGLGSMALHNPEDFLQMIVKASEHLNIKVVLLSGWGGIGEGEEKPENIYCLEDAPHAWLFPRMDALLHHGGAGTTAEAFKSGTPSIIMPFWYDQFFWSEQNYTLGLGPKALDKNALKLDELIEALEQALGNPSYRENIKAIAQNLKNENACESAVNAIHAHISAIV